MLTEPCRKFARLGGLLLFGLVMSVACAKSPQSPSDPGKDVVIFLDFSGSIGQEEKSLFARDLTEQIIPTLGAGDRLLIAPINDRTFTGFRPLVEATFPAQPNFNRWTDNTLDYNKQMKAIEGEVANLREQLRAEVKRLFAQPFSARETDIFSSLLMAEKLFRNQPRRKVLVLMSDMMQDYSGYRFEKVSWTPDANQRLLSDLANKGLIPDLSGICVYVTGVSARSAELAKQIGTFWQAYFDQTKADLDPSRYAHVLLHWPPAKSCRI